MTCNCRAARVRVRSESRSLVRIMACPSSRSGKCDPFSVPQDSVPLSRVNDSSPFQVLYAVRRWASTIVVARTLSRASLPSAPLVAVIPSACSPGTIPHAVGVRITPLRRGVRWLARHRSGIRTPKVPLWLGFCQCSKCCKKEDQ